MEFKIKTTKERLIRIALISSISSLITTSINLYY